jgi:hypothetical protein
MHSVSFHDNVRVGVFLGNVTFRICFVIHLPERIFIKGVIDITLASICDIMDLAATCRVILTCIPTLTTKSCSNVYTTVLLCRQVDGEISPNLRCLDWTR